MTNKEWIDLLSAEFSVSRTSARDMLHALMALKRSDNFKRLFNPLPYESRKTSGVRNLNGAWLRKGHWLRMSVLSEKDDDRYQCSWCGNVVRHKSRIDLYTFNGWCGQCGSDNRPADIRG